MRQRLTAAIVAAVMVSAVVVAARPVAARASAGSAPCTDVQVSTFSAAQMAATRKYWTAQRIAAVARTGQAGQGKPGTAVGTKPEKSQEPVTRTLCVAPVSPGQTSGAPLAPAAPAVRHAVGARTSRPAFGGYQNVGALFEDNNGTLTPHCTASTISAPRTDPNPQNLELLVLTSAHCVKWVSGGTVHAVTNLAFVPQYNNSSGQVAEPFGLWTVSSAVIDSRWTACSGGCPQFDYAILVLAPNNGSQLGNIVGANGWSINEPKTVRNAQLVGYPDANIRPLLAQTTVVTMRAGGQTYRKANYTPLFSNGTSGGPFFASYNAKTHIGTLFGDIGGYQQGGYSDSPSYSPNWTSAFAQLVATAFTLE